MLGTSAPRVLRALADTGTSVQQGRPTRLTAEQVEELRARLGSMPAVDGLSRAETLVAAGLARSPLGLVSQRAVARQAGISPTAVGRALQCLREKGLVSVQERSLPGRRAHRAVVICANYASPEWSRLAGSLALVRRPERATPVNRAARVPPSLDYLFWDTSDSQKDVRQAGGYIARRLLQTEDPEGLAWGAENLSGADWKHAAATRGIAPEARALALNLAGGAGR